MENGIQHEMIEVSRSLSHASRAPGIDSSSSHMNRHLTVPQLEDFTPDIAQFKDSRQEGVHESSFCVLLMVTVQIYPCWKHFLTGLERSRYIDRMLGWFPSSNGCSRLSFIQGR